MQKPIKLSQNNRKMLSEQDKEEELIRDVHLLLKNVIHREETTIKLILDCLYDVGSVNLINQKFHSRCLNKTFKLITRMSKPAFKMFAWQQVKNKSPQLITNWLHNQVSFANQTPSQAEVLVESQTKITDSAAKLQPGVIEVKHLRSQVKLLTGILIGVVAVFGGSFVWLGYTLQQSHLQTVEKLQNQLKILEADLHQQQRTLKSIEPQTKPASLVEVQ
ncbi:MAG: hypothetical protein QNJ47_20180 [Nostocaceae cyanobacterium]|nr:hypothetical protein [Nostocaceae cyanobacterium]